MSQISSEKKVFKTNIRTMTGERSTTTNENQGSQNELLVTLRKSRIDQSCLNLY